MDDKQTGQIPKVDEQTQSARRHKRLHLGLPLDDEENASCGKQQAHLHASQVAAVPHRHSAMPATTTQQFTWL